MENFLVDLDLAKEERDTAKILSLTERPNRYIRRRREEEKNNYEGEKVGEEDPATRKASARGRLEACKVETQNAGGKGGQSIEGCEAISCPRNRCAVACKKSEENTESFTRTACATFGCDEGEVGCEACCRRE